MPVICNPEHKKPVILSVAKDLYEEYNMSNSSRFFANKECEYYPCHKCSVDINCLFCYCPLYDLDCPGNYKYVEVKGRKIKSCMDCIFPHVAENYDKVIEFLKKRGEKDDNT